MGKKVLIMPSPPNSGSLGSTLKFIGLAQNLVEDGWENGFCAWRACCTTG